MLLHPENKVIVLRNPKTGTTTLTYFLENYSILEPLSRYHLRYSKLSNEQKDNYKIYCFYREPVSRFLSGYFYLIKMYSSMEQQNPSLYEKGLEKIYGSTEYRKAHDISMNDILEALSKNIPDIPVLDILHPQTEWINSNVQLLNFHDFENECRKVLRLFDEDPNVKIVKTNSMDLTNKLEPLENNIIKLIHKYYSDDYDFFNEMGITFDV